LFATFYTPECNIRNPLFHLGLHSFTAIKPLFELLYMKLRLLLFSLLLVTVCNVVFAKNPSYIQAKDGVTIFTESVLQEFEEPGPRFTPVDGGFGLPTIQGINKPAFFAYQFLNKLGQTELINNDSRSWVTKNTRGDVQMLLWDFTYTLPGSTNNQNYYTKDFAREIKKQSHHQFIPCAGRKV